MFVSGVYSMYNVTMHYLNSFSSCSIRNLTLASLSRLFTMKIDVFPFHKFLFPQWSFSRRAITENQLHDFLINSRHSSKKYCLHNFTLWGATITIDPEIKCGLRKGDFFKKVVIFQSSSEVITNFFLTNRNNFFYWSSSPKNSKSLMLKVDKVLKLTLFKVRSPRSLTLAFSQIFLVTSIFFFWF